MRKDPTEEVIDKFPKVVQPIVVLLLIGPMVIMSVIEALKGFRK